MNKYKWGSLSHPGGWYSPVRVYKGDNEAVSATLMRFFGSPWSSEEDLLPSSGANAPRPTLPHKER
jgi:hypothetical protein